MLAIPDECTKYNYASITQINPINLDMEYADDDFKVSNNFNNIKKIKNEVPKLLLSRGLEVNNTKTEEYVINKKSTAGKKCTFIGF